jgi:hypothetical protein
MKNNNISIGIYTNIYIILVHLFSLIMMIQDDPLYNVL